MPTAVLTRNAVSKFVALRAGAACLLGALAGPAVAQLDLPSFYADPSKYMLYGCRQLAVARPEIVKRIRELEELMAKASSGPGGALASSMAYRSDYLAAKGDLQNLDARAADRSCPPAAAPAASAPESPPPPRKRQKPVQR